MKHSIITFSGEINHYLDLGLFYRNNPLFLLPRAPLRWPTWNNYSQTINNNYLNKKRRQVRREVRRGKNCLKNKMSVSASMGPSAFSQDGKYYSQIGNDGRCRIWDTETNVLKQEFTPDLHLSAPLSCLYWIQLDSGTV